MSKENTKRAPRRKPRKPRKPRAPRKPRVRNMKALANYGANENRRACHVCGSSDSVCTSVRTTGRLKIRYRKCGKCGAKRTTQEVIATA